MVTIQQGLREDGIHVSMARLCRWFEQPRRTVYYRPTKALPKMRAELAEPIKALIESEPSFGYRTVDGLLEMNKNTVPRTFLLRSDNRLVFTSRIYTGPVRSYGLQQEFITPHCPQQNGMVERLIRTVKEQCVHRHRFENQRHAMRVVADWIQFYNHRRPHQALGMKTPAEAHSLAA